MVNTPENEHLIPVVVLDIGNQLKNTKQDSVRFNLESRLDAIVSYIGYLEKLGYKRARK